MHQLIKRTSLMQFSQCTVIKPCIVSCCQRLLIDLMNCSQNCVKTIKVLKSVDLIIDFASVESSRAVISVCSGLLVCSLAASGVLSFVSGAIQLGSAGSRPGSLCCPSVM